MQNPSAVFFRHYRLPGPWYNVKYAIYYWFFTAIKKLLRVFDVYTRHGRPEDNDGPHRLDDVIGYDATWIGGTTPDGKWIVLAMDRRRDCETSIAYACLKIPGFGYLATPTYPNSVENTLRKSENGFAVDTFTLRTIKPLRQWIINFEGKMIFVDNPKESVYVKITAEWTSNYDVWLLNRDLSSESFAESFALEDWSKFATPLFDRSKDDVVHWEQFGKLDAGLEIDGKPIKIHHAMTVRDRSFGKIRQFSALHRYFYMTMFLENGRSLVITVVCHKITFARLVFGFMSNDDGTNTNVDWVDINLYQFGENGRMPEEMCFLVRTGKVVRAVQFVCTSRHRYRLEKDVVRYEQIGECLLDDQPGKCMVQSLYSETSLKAKTFCEPLTFLDN